MTKLIAARGSYQFLRSTEVIEGKGGVVYFLPFLIYGNLTNAIGYIVYQI